MSEGILPATVTTASKNSNPTNNNLPRGLMSKSGLPFNPNQRLPSLRSSLSKPSLLFQSNVAFTHNPITSLSNTTNNKSPVTNKRNYETITNGSDDFGGRVTTRRQLGEGKGFSNGIKQGKNSLDSWKGTTSSSSSSSTSTSRGRGRRQTNNWKQKKLIQLEGAVFTGAARSPIKSVTDTKKSRSKKALAPSPVQEESEEDSVEPAIIEGKLYQDDFIDRLSDQDDNCEHLPQGWETLSLSTPSSSVKDSITPGHSKSTDWLTPDPLRDKLILFQLPKMLENQTNMKLGKLRIYESGKIELINNPSDLTFEVIKVTESISKSSGTLQSSSSSSSSSTAQPQLPSTFSQSSDGLTTSTESIDKKHELIKVNHIEPRSNREVVIYSGRNLISVGKLEPEVAIVVPKIFNSTS